MNERHGILFDNFTTCVETGVVDPENDDDDKSMIFATQCSRQSIAQCYMLISPLPICWGRDCVVL